MEKGDTLSGIAVKFGVPVWKIVYDNQLKDKNQIVPGQALLLLEVDEGHACGKYSEFWRECDRS